MNYNDKSTRKELLESLKDRNYYVRFNSAFSYIEMDKKDNIFKELNKIQDEFAKDILIYAMYLKNIIKHEEYLLRIKKMEGVLVENVSP